MVQRRVGVTDLSRFIPVVTQSGLLLELLIVLEELEQLVNVLPQLGLAEKLLETLKRGGEVYGEIFSLKGDVMV